jgi:hypothetical protein
MTAVSQQSRPSGASRCSSPPSTTPACPPTTPSPRACAIWQEELLASFDEPTTNGYAEGVINKVIKRAYGIPTFTAFRQRVLLACG